MATLTDAAPTATRTGVRRRVSDLLGDLKVSVATAAGLATAFIDASRLAGPVNAFAAREAYVTGGTVANLGQQRYVLASATGGQLTFAAALPSATAAGDEIELRNLRNQGWGIDEIHRAINYALSDAANGFWAPARDMLSAFSATAATRTVPAAFAVDDPTLAIPNAYSHVYAVEYQDGAGFWHAIPGAREADEPGWLVARGQRTLSINGFWGWEADTRAIRISGYKRFAPMTADTDTTGINIEWLSHQAAAILMMQGRERLGDGSRNQLYMTFQSRADRLRDLLNGPPANGTVSVL